MKIRKINNISKEKTIENDIKLDNCISAPHPEMTRNSSPDEPCEENLS